MGGLAGNCKQASCKIAPFAFLIPLLKGSTRPPVLSGLHRRPEYFLSVLPRLLQKQLFEFDVDIVRCGVVKDEG